MSAQPPSLKLLAVGLAKKLGVPEAEVKRLSETPDGSLSLVMLRVAMGECKRRGLLTGAEEDEIIARARPPVNPMAVMTPVDQAAKPAGTMTVAEVVQAVDQALAKPATRVRAPEWFVNDFWPGALRRLAGGNQMTERDQSIARSVLAELEAP